MYISHKKNTRIWGRMKLVFNPWLLTMTVFLFLQVPPFQWWLYH